MIVVKQADATKTNRLFTRAIAQAVNDLSAIQHRLPWQPHDHFVLVATAELWAYIYHSDEFGGPRDGPTPFHDNIAGLETHVASAGSMSDSELRVLDPRTGSFVAIEVD